jgi:hypothetical protein
VVVDEDDEPPSSLQADPINAPAAASATSTMNIDGRRRRERIVTPTLSRGASIRAAPTLFTVERE